MQGAKHSEMFIFLLLLCEYVCFLLPLKSSMIKRIKAKLFECTACFCDSAGKVKILNRY